MTPALRRLRWSGRTEVQGYPWLPGKFKANLEHRRPLFKNQNNQKKVGNGRGKEKKKGRDFLLKF